MRIRKAWGYKGSGPADTALSILADITEDRAVAERWHQEFKREVVARLFWTNPSSWSAPASSAGWQARAWP